MSFVSRYEQSALGQIQKFKNPSQTLLRRAIQAINKPLESLADAAFDTRVGEAVTKGISGVVNVMNDGASWSVRHQAIFEEFRSDGHTQIREFGDVHQLDLESPDRTVGYLAAKYKALAATEGAAAGLGGAATLALDIPALLGIALRACNEYAAYYGFDPRNDAERVFIMNLLSVASSPSQVAKQSAIAELTELAVTIGKRTSWEELDELLSVQLIRRIAEVVCVRLAKAKLAQVVPIVGAAVGVGYNAYYLSQVTETAYFFYRERFLAEKYGTDIIIAVE